MQNRALNYILINLQSIITINSKFIHTEKSPVLWNNETNWSLFRDKLDYLTEVKVHLKNQYDIDLAVEQLMKNIQSAAWLSTPIIVATQVKYQTPILVRDKISEKRRLRKDWENDGWKKELQPTNNISIKFVRNSKNYCQTSRINIFDATRKD